MTSSRRKTALVVGATSRIGQACIDDLLGHGFHVTCTHARPWTAKIAPALKSQLTQRKLNLDNIEYFKIDQWMENYDLAILIPPIYLSQNILPFAQNSGVKRLVFISSYNTYRFGHTTAYRPLIAAEKAVLKHPLDSLIIQPTMIIGHMQSPATRMTYQRIKQRKPFYGVTGREALQQPIDFRDLARAIIYAGLNLALEKARYPVAGENILKNQELITNLSAIIGQTPRFVNAPYFLTRPARYLAGRLIPDAAITAYLSRLGEDRHAVHPLLPGWSPHYSLKDSLDNLQREQSSQS